MLSVKFIFNFLILFLCFLILANKSHLKWQEFEREFVTIVTLDGCTIIYDIIICVALIMILIIMALISLLLPITV